MYIFIRTISHYSTHYLHLLNTLLIEIDGRVHLKHLRPATTLFHNFLNRRFLELQHILDPGHGPLDIGTVFNLQDQKVQEGP